MHHFSRTCISSKQSSDGTIGCARSLEESDATSRWFRITARAARRITEALLRARRSCCCWGFRDAARVALRRAITAFLPLSPRFAAATSPSANISVVEMGGQGRGINATAPVP